MKKIWIINHYATSMYIQHGGRHYWMAKELIQNGYEVRVFCANTVHNTVECIDLDNKLYKQAECDNIPFVVVNTSPYNGNGVSRLINMLSFWKNVKKAAIKYAKEDGCPDVILASSVHPLTLLAGQKLAKKYKIPCICEVRDLWPETLVCMGKLKKDAFFTKMLYIAEHRIYKKADVLVGTMEGLPLYIKDKGWERGIDLKKIYYINNGVDLAQFLDNKEKYTIPDEDLDNTTIFKVIYTGSIRRANQVHFLVECAERLIQFRNIKILIWGSGDEENRIRQEIKNRKLTNIVLKGTVDKKYIPYILSKSDLNIYILPNLSLYKYGLSLNKSFEYFASGKPVLASSNSGYSIIDHYHCGECVDTFSPEKFAETILKFMQLPKDDYIQYCKNAERAAQDYDFSVLTQKLINVINIQL